MIRPGKITEPIEAKAKFLPFIRFLDLAGHLDAMYDAGVKGLETIQAARPYAVCPSCKGVRCSDCRNAGYVPEWRYSELA